jgi:ribulose-5-phosphate 4-epimerase/fuculose-1-phosphate aldolase
MTSTQFYDAIAYHDYEGVSLYLDERERLLDALGDAKAMILRNHGLLTLGRTVPEAFLSLYRLERACQVQIDAQAAGPVRQLSSNVAGRSRGDLERAATDKPRGDLEFAALMRKLDKTDDSYRN